MNRENRLLESVKQDLLERRDNGIKIELSDIENAIAYRAANLGLNPLDIDCNKIINEMKREFLDHDHENGDPPENISVISAGPSASWLTDGQKSHRPFWSRYRRWLANREKPWSAKNIEYLDHITEAILGRMGNPLDRRGWGIRGLVVGDVQSGKTSNYTGLICKAADAGYKIIIVLAGTQNDLRLQTQERLEEGFLGYNTMNHDPLGVCEKQTNNVWEEVYRANSFTTCDMRYGDFKTARMMGHYNVNMNTDIPSLFVVKKGPITKSV